MKSIYKKLVCLATLSLTTLHCKEKKSNKTYIWGNGIYQARPDAILQFKNFKPKEITNVPKNLIKLQFGQYYQAGITSQGQLYIWQKYELDSNENQLVNDNIRKNIELLSKSIKIVKFTQGYIWSVNKQNQVYQWPIVKQFDKEGKYIGKKLGKSREVQPLKGTIQLSSGNDHILALNQKGEVYAMGDDTFGQCGQCDTDKHTHPPFMEKRIKYPTKPNLPKIKKIIAGSNHSLALDQTGNLYGWGSNSTMQLSHQQQYSQMNNPLLCSYNPIKISKNLDNNEILDIEAGQQFTIIVTENRKTNSCQIFSTGSNLRGQLGIGQIRHLKDLTRVQSLSNYIMNIKGKTEKVFIKQIQCGYKHCIALLNIGYIMEWGDNQYGQMGNQKRSSILSPAVLKDFIGKNVLGVYAGANNSGVIIQENNQ